MAGSENREEAIETAEPTGEEVLRTFLIADVRGYTRFTQTRGDEAAAELAGRFAQLTREVVTAGGGDLIELRGDEALAVFTSPRQAVRTAVDIQRRLRGASSPDEALPLGIGIGLDTGEALPVEGGYRGKALNVAARLCSLAAPGQTFATETVSSLAGSVPGVQFAPRKPVRVKGIEQPVRLLEVVPEGGLPELRPLDELTPRRPRRQLALLGAAAALVAVAVAVAALTVFGEEGSAGRLAANSLGALDSSGAVKDVIPVGDGPADVVYGAKSLWVANELDRSVWRVDPRTQALAQLPLDAQPAALAFGDDALWVLDPPGRQVLRMDAEKGQERVVEDYAVGNGASDVAFGGEAVWVTNQLDGTVTRISVRGRAQTIGVGIEPISAAFGNGALWVANAGGDNVVRIDAATREVESIPVGHEPRAVAVGSRSVWVASAVDGTVWELDPQTRAARRTVAVGPAPAALAATEDGGIWVASEATGAVTRVDGNGATTTHEVGGGPTALVVVDDRVWVTALAPRSSHRGGTLRIAGGFPVTDPQIPSFGANINPALGDGLVAFRVTGGPGGATLVPDLATALPRPTNGGKRYTFHLRQGVRYSNGEEVKPSHFRFTLQRLFRVGETGASFEALRGAPDCLEHHDRCDLSGAVFADDGAMTLTFVLSRPDPSFLYRLAFPSAWVVPPGTPMRRLDTEIVPSTGPYRIASVEAGKRMVLERNPHFREWSHEAQPDGYPDRIVVTGPEGPDPLKQVLDGKADAMAGPLPPERASELAVRRPSQIHATRTSGLFYVFMNTKLAPFDDVRVRQAVSLAFDRSALVRRLGGPLFAQPTCQLIPPNLPGYRPYCPWTGGARAGVWSAPDPGRARSFVRASRTRGARVTVWTWDGDPLRAIASELAATLGRLGYRVQTHTVHDTPFDYYGRAAEPSSRAQTGPERWGPDLPVPGDMFGPVLSCSAPPQVNLGHFCDKQIDAAAERATVLQPTDPKAAADAWAELDERVVQAAPIVPVAVESRPELVSRRVGNYQAHPVWGVLYTQLWVR